MGSRELVVHMGFNKRTILIVECIRVYLKCLIDDSEGSFQCCRHVCFVRNFIGVTEVMGSCSSRQSNIDFDGEGKNRMRELMRVV